MPIVHVEAGKTYLVSKLTGLNVTGYTEILAEPGDFFVRHNKVYFTASEYVPDGDNVNNDTEIRFMNKHGNIVSRDDFEFEIVEHLPKTINGNNGNNTLNGTNGDDAINGRGGHDKINAKSGDDILIGGIGNDILIGGEGGDTFTGGMGRDTFRTGYGEDTITDFNPNQDKFEWKWMNVSNQSLQELSIDQENGTLVDFGDAGDVFLEGFHWPV